MSRAGLLRLGYGALRPLLFRARGGNPEAIHEDTIHVLAAISGTPLATMTSWLCGKPHDPISVAGVQFPGRVGLAAGMDKDGLAARMWARLGFSFAELGTVTASAQPGNPKPRVFRLVNSHGLINRMGFNNEGANALAARLAAWGVKRGENTLGIPLGVSIGKTKIVDLNDAVADYVASFRAVCQVADYVAVNVSSPNTPGLRELQGKEHIAQIVSALVEEAARGAVLTPQSGFCDGASLAQNDGQEDSSETAAQNDGLGDSGTTQPHSFRHPESSPPRPPVPPSLRHSARSRRIHETGGDSALGAVPIFVKLAPDLSDQGIDELVEVVEAAGASGLIATNTTIARSGIADADRRWANEAGGLSGLPLTSRARQVVKRVVGRTSLPVMASGGIMTVDDAQAMLDAGAALVQVYTGFIYSGPALVAGINERGRK